MKVLRWVAALYGGLTALPSRRIPLQGRPSIITECCQYKPVLGSEEVGSRLYHDLEVINPGALLVLPTTLSHPSATLYQKPLILGVLDHPPIF